MILSDVSLRKLINQGSLTIEPCEDKQIQPASVDLRLGRHFLKLDENMMEAMSLKEEPEYRELHCEEIVIPPHSFLLASTKEHIKLCENLTAFVEGRSSIGRMGLFIQNAGWVDPGFAGYLTLELYNANRLPIKLQADRRICQLVFARTDEPAAEPYSGKYQGQERAVGSRAYLDRENIEEQSSLQE